MRVIVGPLEKQYPETRPRKMFKQQCFIPYPRFTAKDSRARNGEMATWINKFACEVGTERCDGKASHLGANYMRKGRSDDKMEEKAWYG